MIFRVFFLQEKRDQSIVHQAMVMENMPQMADFVYKFYNQKLMIYQEKKRVRFRIECQSLEHFCSSHLARRTISL